MIRMAAKSLLIHVRTIDGEQKTLPLQEDIYHKPVAELVEIACNKIGISINNNYSYTTASSPCMLIERCSWLHV